MIMSTQLFIHRSFLIVFGVSKVPVAVRAITGVSAPAGDRSSPSFP